MNRIWLVTIVAFLIGCGGGELPSHEELAVILRSDIENEYLGGSFRANLDEDLEDLRFSVVWNIEEYHVMERCGFIRSIGAKTFAITPHGEEHISSCGTTKNRKGREYRYCDFTSLYRTGALVEILDTVSLSEYQIEVSLDWRAVPFDWAVECAPENIRRKIVRLARSEKHDWAVISSQ